MPACTFFGHRDCPPCVREMLQAALVTLIAQYGVDFFYIGCQGKFDAMARTLLRRLCAEYPHIGYAVVLPMLPRGRAGNGCLDFSDTIFPKKRLQACPRAFRLHGATTGCLRMPNMSFLMLRMILAGLHSICKRRSGRGKRSSIFRYRVARLPPHPGISPQICRKMRKKTIDARIGMWYNSSVKRTSADCAVRAPATWGVRARGCRRWKKR